MPRHVNSNGIWWSANVRTQLNLLKANREQQVGIVKVNREHWERTLEGLVSVMLPLVVLVAAIFVGIVTWLNVRERRAEIGLLRALGKRTSQIAALFLVKAVLIGLLGGVAAGLVCLAAYGLLSGSGRTGRRGTT